MLCSELRRKISAVRVKVVDVNVVVYSRDYDDAELQVFRRCDYISCTFEEVLNSDEAYMATELGKWDVFLALPKKHLHVGYAPIPRDVDRTLGAMKDAYTTDAVSVSGKETTSKQVQTAYFFIDLF